MRYDILHRTRYVYAAPVRDSFNDVRLEPLSTIEQTVESFLLRVLPAGRMNHYTDFYGNWIHHFEIPEAHAYLLIESQSRVKTHPIVPLAAEARPCALTKVWQCAGHRTLLRLFAKQPLRGSGGGILAAGGGCDRRPE